MQTIAAREIRTRMTVEIDGEPFPVWACTRYRDGRVVLSNGDGARAELDADAQVPVVSWQLLDTREEVATDA